MAAKDAPASPWDGVKTAFQGAVGAVGDRAAQVAKDKATGLTERLNDLAEGGVTGRALAAGAAESAEGGSKMKGAVKGGLSAIKDKVSDALPGGAGSDGDRGETASALKAMNIVETIDVGVPARVAYNQWTQYQDWPDFMKKVEHAEQQFDEPAVEMKAKVFLSHRRWKSTILDQIPDERILWRSTGEKGHVDGCVTFHEIGPRLTRILVTLEYYPQGFVERVGNIWRAPGRRARLELKNFRRHVMLNTILNPDEVEGWRGEIEDSEVIRTHDEGLADDRELDGDQEPDEAGQNSDDTRDAAEGGEDEEAADEETDEPDETEDDR